MLTKRLHPVAFTALITGTSIILAVLAATVAMLWAGYSDFLFAFGLSAGIPAIVAPITIYPLVRSNRQLRNTQAELRRVAMTDALTGLPNRRHFFSHAEQLFGVAAIRGESIAILMMDLDRFKEVNDTYGHIVGDGVLAAVGARIRDTVLADSGEADRIVARLGGEEFAVLASAMTSTAAARLAERIRRNVSGAPFEQRGILINATVSIGISIGSAATGVDAIMKAADDAAYRAKRAGRDRWSFADRANDYPPEAAVG